jgi:hypothetical protein
MVHKLLSELRFLLAEPTANSKRYCESLQHLSHPCAATGSKIASFVPEASRGAQTAENRVRLLCSHSKSHTYRRKVACNSAADGTRNRGIKCYVAKCGTKREAAGCRLWKRQLSGNHAKSRVGRKGSRARHRVGWILRESSTALL